MLPHLLKIRDSFFDIFLPRECFSCGTIGSWLCRPCAESQPLLTALPCPSCNAPLIQGMVHAQCRQKLSLAYLLAASPLRHQPIHSLILGAKFHGLQSAALILAHLCIQSLDRPHLAEVINPRTTLCAPIPMHTIKENYRGYNQASLMAREIAKKLHLTYADLLTCRRPIRDQMKLPKLERFKNLSHAFTAAIPIPEKIQTILLVDDVITTGATMISAATTLSQTILRPLTIIGVAAAYNDSRNY